MENQKKRSLDEILADLNKILGKMPDLIEKVKPIEIKPINFGEVLDKNISMDLNDRKDENKSVKDENSDIDKEVSNTGEKLKNITEIEDNKDISKDEIIPEKDMALNISKDNIKTEEENGNNINILENTNDFGVPDIDALLNLSKEKQKEELDSIKGEGKKIEDLTGGTMESEENKKTNDSQDNNLQIDNLSLQENNLDLKNIELNIDSEIKENKTAESISGDEIKIKEDLNLQLNSSADNAPSSNDINEKTISNISFENNLIKETDKEVNLESITPIEKKEDAEISFNGINLEDIKLEETDRKESGINLKIDKDSEEKTILFNTEQNKNSLDSEDKTILFAPSQKAESAAFINDSLIDNEEKAKDIPSERVKNIGIITAFDQEFTNLVLKEIDEICFSSKDKPMYMKRVFAINYTEDINANFILEKAKESNVVAVLSIGDFPSEKNYELNSIFSTAKIIFKNIDHANFNKNNILDFIMDVIISL